MFDVRWLAAEGLIAIGRPTLIPSLRRLSEKSDSLWLREGAHHVPHGINMGNQEEILLPVRNALEDIEAPLVVPFVAQVGLKSLTEVPPRRLKKSPNKRNVVELRKRFRKYPERCKVLLYANQPFSTIDAGGSPGAD